MVVACRVIHAVIDDVAAVGVGSHRLVGRGVGKAAAALGRINEVVSIPDFAQRRRLIEAGIGIGESAVFRHFAGDDVLQIGAIQHMRHVLRVNLRDERALEAARDIHLPVIIHQHTGVDEPAVDAHRIRNRILVAPQQRERAFGAVGHSDAPLRADDVGEEVILSILLHHVWSIQLVVFLRPVGVGGMVERVARAENNAVIRPVTKIVHRRGPALQHIIAELVVPDSVMRAVDIHAVAKHARFAVWNVLPQRQIGIRHG